MQMRYPQTKDCPGMKRLKRRSLHCGRTVTGTSCTYSDVIRRRMQEDGQLILAVEPPAGEAQLRIQAVQTSDGKQWWSAFTGFEEELKGSGSVMSTFLTEIRKLFESALSVNEIQGIILNPWNRTLMLDKTLLRIILGK